jgi:hypothetical protein
VDALCPFFVATNEVEYNIFIQEVLKKDTKMLYCCSFHELFISHKHKYMYNNKELYKMEHIQSLITELHNSIDERGQIHRISQNHSADFWNLLTRWDEIQSTNTKSQYAGIIREIERMRIMRELRRPYDSY